MDTLNNLIADFSVDKLEQFFRQKINTFKPDEEDYEYLFEDNENITDNYEDILKIGEADLINSDDLLVITAKTLAPLTNRTGKKRQFEIAKKILKEENKDASFFIFYDDNGNFRFSLIRANFLGAKRDFTDFKRYTYFVSPTQTNNTFLRQINVCDFNVLDSILEAFSVEPLNKQFYEQVAESFYTLIGGNVGAGKKAKKYKAALLLPGHNIKSNRRIYQEFAVRLIGRAIFVWFLKNKTSENNLPLIPKDWLSSQKVDGTKNYYHSLLEKLFFEILNKPINERIEDLPKGQEIIPFLNGGLFEPQHDDFYDQGFGGYSKFINTLKIPDKWLFNFFETLEQFNFTIDENSINDQEVSIDPEMLGTIFENLLAEIDPDTEKSARKSTGSFYTPREIVDYMVEESLVSYLKTKTNTGEEKLRNLFKENDLPEDYFQNTTQIINAFNEIKILDPACGSGAFPMGALHKINMALQKLDPDAEIWKDKQLEKIDNVAYRKALKDKLDKSNVDYIRKLGIIQHSIYGVDIQPIATEISKLRSFLSLVVDENINDKAVNRGIYPLPNLEFKFVTANTLIGLEKSKDNQGSLDFGETEIDIDKLQKIRDKYLQSFSEEKENLKQQFLDLQNQIAAKEFGSQVGAGNIKAQQIIGWNPFSHEKSNWFDSKWMFGFEKFDIVIGNPPYIGQKGNNKIFKPVKQSTLGKFHQRRMDYFYFFFHQAINLSKTNGVINFITTNYYLTATYADILRKDIKERTSVRELVNFNELKIFESALGQHNLITFLTKSKNPHPVKVIDTTTTGFANSETLKNILHGTDIDTAYYEMPNQNIFEGKLNYIRLQNKSSTGSGIENILEVIEISGKALSDICHITAGIQTGCDKLSNSHIEKYGVKGNIGDGIFALSNNEIQELNLTNSEINYLKPWFKNSDVSKWVTNKFTDESLIYYTSKTEGRVGINLLNHFESFKPILINRNTRSGTPIITNSIYDKYVKGNYEISYVMVASAFKRGDYYCVSYARDKDVDYFEAPKIVAPQRSYRNTFGYNESSFYASADVYFIIQKDTNVKLKYILGLLNSELYFNWLYFKGKRKGKMLELYLTPLSEIPIKIANETTQKQMELLVNQIISEKKRDPNADISDIEKNINIMVYKLYELSYEEVKIIDSEFKLTQEEYKNGQ